MIVLFLVRASSPLLISNAGSVSMWNKLEVAALWLSHCMHYDVEVAGLDNNLALRQ
jgi:hypothetical protein